MHVTTNDDLTLKGAVVSTTEEQELWNLAIDDQFSSFNESGTWVIDNDLKSQSLPTHVVFKI